ncbi:MAG: hypothetical protein H6R19_1606 [Proteobacteria bacterium]|nr:hypothetical protein [Pseudomonadota bacterium]
MRNLSVLLILLTSASAHAASLTVHLSGLPDTQGNVMLAVYASEAAYKAKEPCAKAKLPANGVLQKEFTHLSPGQYLVSVYHDANQNEKLDRNASGMPLEAYGFSQNPSSRFGPPDFNAAAVRVDKENTRIEITLE